MSRALWLVPLFVVVGCAKKTPEVEAPLTPAPANTTSQAKTDQDSTTNARAETTEPASANRCSGLTVHFEFNSDILPESERPALQRGAECLKTAKNLQVTITGNADERGTEEYNLALGDRRAMAVEKYLRALGVDERQMRTISYGENRPVCNEHDELCWTKNRRAEIEPGAPTGQPAG